MDIEQYLEQKRTLEAKKELLETKEKLKEDSERKKRELEKEKKKVGSERPTPSEPSTPLSAAPSDPYKKIFFFNIIILIIIVLGVFAWMYLSQGESNQNTNVTAVLQTQNTSSAQPSSPPSVDTTATPANTTPSTTKYPGPEFNLYAEDKELGLFDSAGKLDGETLVISSPYYKDAVLHLENEEAAVIKCFIDRTVLVDENGDGKEELIDLDLDFVKDELDPGQKTELDESLPGAFDQGTYKNKGKITAEYEARCYYCIDPECNEIDKNGESKETAKIKFQILE